MRSVSAALLLTLLIAPVSRGQNLLVNPSFETGGIAGWTDPGGNIGINTLLNNYPSPGVAQDGATWIGKSCAYGSGTQTPELRQTVTVSPGQPYRLSVWVHTEGSPNLCSAFLQWRDGVDPGANGQCTTLDSRTSGLSPGWHQLSGTAVPSGTRLTLGLRLSWNCGGSGGGGNFDNASVTLDVACTDPSTVTGCAPASITIPPDPGTVTLTISGTNLLNVTGVSLTGPATVVGVINNGTRTAGQFQAAFNLGRQPVGSYGITVTRNAPCLNASLPNAFAINCAPGQSCGPPPSDLPAGLDTFTRFDQIARLRSAVYTYQASSRDPTGGNVDTNNYLSNIGGEHLLLDVKGPGCIYRIWMTGDMVGNIRIYFDGSATPKYDWPKLDFFRGDKAPFLSPLVGNDNVSSGGFYIYLPMPFRQGCRIVTTGADHYYDISYQRFASADGITTFTGNENSSPARAVWNSAGTDPKADPGSTTLTQNINLASGASATLANLPGAGSVQRVELTIPGLPAGDPSRATLSNLRLKITWDGAGQPAVDVPVGDFFGSGMGLAVARGLPVGMDGTRLYCYFPMPYATGALIQLLNQGNAAVTLTYVVRYTPLAQAPAGTGRFHARFMSETPTSNGRDYLMLDETGAGHLVGVVHTMKGFAGFPQDYLEGDERIHVDGSLTPQIYGTGTEDFYNGGWYFSKGPFHLPTHGAPLMVTKSPYENTCYRFFISDPIPFTRSIFVGMEHGPRNDVNGNYRSVAMYYKRTQPLSALTDELDVGNAVSESAHQYAVVGQTFSGNTTSSYEGDHDDVNLTDDGRRFNGSSSFNMAITPGNVGALLRRRMDYSRGFQEARVYVDNVLAGTWYDPGSNSTDSFRDSEFLIPAVLTQGKSGISIRIEKTSTQSDWTEYRYWLFALLPIGPAMAVQPGSVEVSTFVGQDPPARNLTLFNTGEGTLNYSATTQAAWLDILPISGSLGSGGSQPVTVSIHAAGLSVGDHTGTITITDPAASNSPLSVPVIVHILTAPGDMDGDGDVDQTDFGLFQDCYSGAGFPQDAPACTRAKLDDDADVDQADFGLFKQCMSGANVPADPNCIK